MRLPAVFISKQCATALAACLSIGAASRTEAASVLETMDGEVSSLYQRSKDGIVRVHAQRPPAVSNSVFRPPHRVGTGFFIDAEGRLLTAATVVGDATNNCWIDWAGKEIPAKVLGTDPEVNLSLLQVDPEKCIAAGRRPPFLAQGNSDELKVGSLVVAVGFPPNTASTPSVGFVGGFDINYGSNAFLTSYLRAGCRLLRGQGGSPLLNARGEVMGIAIATLGDDQCYGLPINAARKVVADILQNGRTQHGYVGLGISEQQLISTSTIPGRRQVIVQQVFSNSPAALAGFREQDILVRICTNQIQHAADVLDAMFQLRCGDETRFLLLRDAVTQEVTVVIGHRPVADIPKPPVTPLQWSPRIPIIIPASANQP